MAQRFEARSYVTDANVNDQNDTGSLPATIEAYLPIDRPNDDVIAITSCKLKGDRIFTLVIMDNDFVSGGD
mgnify:CR=1 FL=1